MLSVVNVTLFFFLCWIALYFYTARKFNHWKKKNVHYIEPLPFFGSAFKVFTLRETIGQLCRKIYETTTLPFVGFFVSDEPYLLIRDPELVKTILVKEFSSFSNRTITENKEDDPMGAHLLFILKNPDWRYIRRKITPVFTASKMKAMYALIQECGSEMIKFLKKEVEKNPMVDIRDTAAKYTTDAITSSAFGLNANSFKETGSKFRELSETLLNWGILERAISTSLYFVAPNLVKWLKIKFIDTASADFFRNVFWKTMFEREKNNFHRNDLLDILLEIKNLEEIDDPYKLEGDKLVAQATQFFLAGYETTASAITFTLYELAKNVKIQNKLREEVQETINKHGEVSYSLLSEMEFLDMCVKESLRKYPPLPFLDRRCNSNYQIPGTNVVIEKETAVIISVLGLHYDPQYYSDPEKFDPTRFTKENVDLRLPFTYLPFGDGPRNCIGVRFGNTSVKSSVAQIISMFQVELGNETLLQLDTKGFLMAPVGKVLLKFKKL